MSAAPDFGAPAATEPEMPPRNPTPSAAERPGPLHDPDPYGTPPYGQPGPWAPAPPVQHPAATPAHGTAIAAPATAPQGPAAPAPPGRQGAGLPAPTGPQGPGASASAGPQGPALPAHPAPRTVPIPTPPGPPIPADALAPAHAQSGALAPAHPQPGALAPAHAQPGASACPTRRPHTAVSSPTDAPPPPALDGTTTPPAPDPWRRYDPWAAASQAHAPLQQTGAAVLTVQQRRRRAKRILVGGALVLALVSGGVGGVVGAFLEREGGTGSVRLPQAGEEPSGRPADSVAGIAARALPSVVTLHVKGSDEQGTGTGFVLDTRGHILTNNHVVEPAASSGDITVTFSSGDTAKARVIGRDTGYDLAVVQVSGVHGLTPMPLGNSDNVQVGDPVVAIGAPFDLAGTVTSGIISAKERPITAGGESGDGSDVSYVDALQTDAPINPGNSGGPLLDSRGRVVGINSAIRSAGSGSDSGGGQAGSIGLGFAIPVNQARRVAEELINTGKATHPVIGVTLDMGYNGDGARIGAKGGDGGPAVTTGGPADRAGLEAGDVITGVDGKPVHSGDELIIRTRAHRPGDHLRLTVRRDGRTKEVSLTLGSSGRH
ncbi:trypsin-like peptidase domain-containing protein [Streptomyces sp. NPDC051636]|uniref:trypsin-like peptidase domain-containing protein n=1 Tax=Streptomyces sp. NPDC051636 TaxID=3365663 RepID=UPI00378DD4CD